MDGLKSWAVSIIISALSGAVISILVPKGSAEKTMRAVIGIFMVSAVCMPLAQLKITDETVEAFSFEEYEVSDAESMDEYLVTEYENTVRETVDAAAKEFGIDEYEVVSEISKGSDGCIIIHGITVTAFGEDAITMKEFEFYLSEKLGVTVTVLKGN